MTELQLIARTKRELLAVLARTEGRYSDTLGKAMLRVLKKWIKQNAPQGTNVTGMERSVAAEPEADAET